MDALKARIKAFNETIDRLFGEDEDSEFRIEQIETANVEQLNQLQSFFDTKIPTELTAFYQQLGGLKNDADGSYHIQIPPVSEILEQLKAEKNYDKRHSIGLIDGIKHSWSNDRPEFDGIPKSKIDSINTNYKCIGLYRFDWQFEEAFYIYFDKNHQFGLVRYHQDEFDELWDEHLTPMLTQSQAKQTLQELIIQIIDHLEEGIIADEEDD